MKTLKEKISEVNEIKKNNWKVDKRISELVNAGYEYENSNPKNHDTDNYEYIYFVSSTNWNKTFGYAVIKKEGEVDDEIKGYTGTTVGYDEETYETRASLYFEDGKIHVGQYEYLDKNQDWQPLFEERQDLEEEINNNYSWDQL